MYGLRSKLMFLSEPVKVPPKQKPTSLQHNLCIFVHDIFTLQDPAQVANFRLGRSCLQLTITPKTKWLGKMDTVTESLATKSWNP